MGDNELREIASHLGDRMTQKCYINSFKMASTKVQGGQLVCCHCMMAAESVMRGDTSCIGP